MNLRVNNNINIYIPSEHRMDVFLESFEIEIPFVKIK